MENAEIRHDFRTWSFLYEKISRILYSETCYHLDLSAQTVEAPLDLGMFDLRQVIIRISQQSPHLFFLIQVFS